MSKWACNSKYVNIDDVKVELERVKSLLQVIIEDYFGWNEEFAKENAFLLASQYERYSDLLSISIGLVNDSLDTVAIVGRNIEKLEGRCSA